MLIATEDTVVSPIYSKRLSEKWGGKVLFQEIQGESHDSILNNEKVWEKISNFLERI